MQFPKPKDPLNSNFS